jgi:hypothetical protein
LRLHGGHAHRHHAVGLILVAARRVPPDERF